MSGLTIRNVIKRYGDVQVMHGVDLDIQDGEHPHTSGARYDHRRGSARRISPRIAAGVQSFGP